MEFSYDLQSIGVTGHGLERKLLFNGKNDIRYSIQLCKIPDYVKKTSITFEKQEK